jgi:hypothetical protein
MDKPLPFTPAPIPPQFTKEELERLTREELDRLRGGLTPDQFRELISSMPIPTC